MWVCPPTRCPSRSLTRRPESTSEHAGARNGLDLDLPRPVGAYMGCSGLGQLHRPRISPWSRGIRSDRSAVRRLLGCAPATQTPSVIPTTRLGRHCRTLGQPREPTPDFSASGWTRVLEQRRSGRVGASCRSRSRPDGQGCLQLVYVDSGHLDPRSRRLDSSSMRAGKVLLPCRERVGPDEPRLGPRHVWTTSWLAPRSPGHGATNEHCSSTQPTHSSGCIPTRRRSSECQYRGSISLGLRPGLLPLRERSGICG